MMRKVTAISDSTFLRQTMAALSISASGLRRRWWSSLNAALGTAVVVAVLVALLAIGAGYGDALRLATADDQLMILRSGARSEMESSLSAEQVDLVARAQPAGAPPASAEVYAVASLELGASGKPANVALRGIFPASLALRPGAKIVEGRLFAPGRREIVVGRLAQKRFGGLGLGTSVTMAGGSWAVVGVFEAGGGISESEMWAEAPMVQSAYSRGDSYNLVLAAALPGLDPEALEESLNRDPRMNVTVMRQADYYSEQAGAMQGFVGTLGYSVALLMALGAVFASLNTGFAHVRTRAKELATLAALGWSTRVLMLSVALETLALALAGAAIGALMAHLIFDGRVISTLFYAKDFTQVVFAFAVNGWVLAQAALLALAIGSLGMIGPALSVRRLPVARILANRR